MMGKWPFVPEFIVDLSREGSQRLIWILRFYTNARAIGNSMNAFDPDQWGLKGRVRFVEVDVTSILPDIEYKDADV